MEVRGHTLQKRGAKNWWKNYLFLVYLLLTDTSTDVC